MASDTYVPIPPPTRSSKLSRLTHRKFSYTKSGQFYNDTHGTDIVGPNANHKCSIHHWAEHGIAGRGVLLDYRAYALANNIKYDAYTSHSISYVDLYACGKAQGIDIRPAAQGGDIKVGDILFIRSGWKEAYDSKTDEENAQLATRHAGLSGPVEGEILEFAGVKQEQEILDWLHDSYFAAVAGDAPSFETWPTKQGGFSYLLN